MDTRRSFLRKAAGAILAGVAGVVAAKSVASDPVITPIPESLMDRYKPGCLAIKYQDKGMTTVYEQYERGKPPVAWHMVNGKRCYLPINDHSKRCSWEQTFTDRAD